MIDDEIEEEDVEKELEDDFNVFDQLLSLQDKVFSVNLTAPYLDGRVIVYYMVLRSGDYEPPGLDPDFMTWGTKRKAEYLLDISEERVWAQIDKAQKTGDVPGRYMLTKKKFFALKEQVPEIFNEIVGIISGRAMKYIDFFTSGPQKAE